MLYRQRPLLGTQRDKNGRVRAYSVLDIRKRDLARGITKHVLRGGKSEGGTEENDFATALANDDEMAQVHHAPHGSDLISRRVSAP